MRTIFVIIMIAAIALLALPPQVKTIEHTHTKTQVSFWYPSIIKVRGEIVFSDQIVFTAEENADWSVDSLRSVSFLCGSSNCKSEKNPIAAAWEATNISIDISKKDRERITTSLAAAQSKRQSMVDYLEKNSCDKIIIGPEKPTFACSEAEAESVATTTCTIRELGPKFCEKWGKEILENDAPKFLNDAVAREGCGALAHEIIGEEYNILDKTIKRYTTDLFLTISSWAIGQVSKDLKNGFDWSVAALKAKACIPSGINLCRRKFAAWQEATAAHFEKFAQSILYCNEARTILSSAESDLSSNQRDLESVGIKLRQLTEEKNRLEQAHQIDHVPHMMQQL